MPLTDKELTFDPEQVRAQVEPAVLFAIVDHFSRRDEAQAFVVGTLMGTEEVEVTFTDEGIKALAKIAADVNQSIENIGARRLYTVMERVFEELSFSAPDRTGEKITVDGDFVEKNLGELTRSTDLSRYVL